MRADQPRHLVRIDVEITLADVREHGPRAGVHDDVGGRRPGDRRRDHLVAGPDAERDQRHVERRRAGRDRERVLRADILGEPPLELRRPRPGRQPARPERLGDSLDLLVPDRRGLEGEEGVAARTGVRRELLHCW